MGPTFMRRASVKALTFRGISWDAAVERSSSGWRTFRFGSGVYRSGTAAPKREIRARGAYVRMPYFFISR